MKKSYILAILAAVILVVGSFGSILMQKRNVPNSTIIATSTPVIATSTSIASSTTVTATTSTIDYSKLQKDTIYTEEEGKYENLSAEGKLLLGQLIMPRCTSDKQGMYCDERVRMLNGSAIVSLKNSFMFYGVSNISKPGINFYIYDFKNSTYPQLAPLTNWDWGIRGAQTFVLFRGDSKLLYYGAISV